MSQSCDADVTHGEGFGRWDQLWPWPSSDPFPDAAKDNDEKVPELTCALLFCGRPTLLSPLLNQELKPVGIAGFLLCALLRA